MGFDCKEELSIPRLGLVVSGCYITLKGTIIQIKGDYRPFALPGIPMSNSTLSPYTIYGKYHIYATKDAPESLYEESIQMGIEESSTDPLGQLYTFLKEQKFAGKTLTDN